jgi:hypothetical protein
MQALNVAGKHALLYECAVVFNGNLGQLQSVQNFDQEQVIADLLLKVEVA